MLVSSRLSGRPSASQSVGLETSMTLVSTRRRHVVVGPRRDERRLVSSESSGASSPSSDGGGGGLRRRRWSLSSPSSSLVVVVGLRRPIGRRWRRRRQLSRRTDGGAYSPGALDGLLARPRLISGWCRRRRRRHRSLLTGRQRVPCTRGGNSPWLSLVPRPCVAVVLWSLSESRVRPDRPYRSGHRN